MFKPRLPGQPVSPFRSGVILIGQIRAVIAEQFKPTVLVDAGVGGEVTRPEKVTCQYLDLNGAPQIITVRGFLARAVLHETDHLGGVLYIDRMSDKDRSSVSGKLQKLAAKNGGVE